MYGEMYSTVNVYTIAKIDRKTRLEIKSKIDYIGKFHWKDYIEEDVFKANKKFVNDLLDYLESSNRSAMRAIANAALQKLSSKQEASIVKQLDLVKPISTPTQAASPVVLTTEQRRTSSFDSILKIVNILSILIIGYWILSINNRIDNMSDGRTQYKSSRIVDSFDKYFIYEPKENYEVLDENFRDFIKYQFADIKLGLGSIAQAKTGINKSLENMENELNDALKELK